MLPTRSKKVLLYVAVVIIICLFATCQTEAEALAVDGAADSTNDDNPNNKNDGSGTSSQQEKSSPPTLPLLDSNSVVLITGAAGFIGSELALALKRTYNVRKLLLVDHLGMESDNESYFIPPPKDRDRDTYTTMKAYEKYDKETMSLFELKRQRIFRISQELTAANLDEDSIEDDNHYYRPDSIKFYRADMRPSIPEFFDMGEQPLLEGIFASHPDITHVVHLADDDVYKQNNAVVPRNRDSIKAGRMEGILEEMRLILERKAAEDKDNEEELQNADDTYSLPQFVYASSYEVYDYIVSADDTREHHQPNPLPFREDKPITTPSSLHGASKLIDEILASAYHSTHGIFSVGLRFFPVYGPWGNPGSDIFDLAEEICSRDIIDDEKDAMNEENYNRFEEDVRDYVYIDDAVDAIISAMQYRPPQLDPPPVIFNVGTGEGTSLKKIRDEMTSHFPINSLEKKDETNRHRTKRQVTESYASTELAKSHLGFEAQVPLSVGIAKTLKWFRGRSFPYGSDSNDTPQQKRVYSFVDNSLEGATKEECSPFDRECLRGTPVFPCASECSNADSCTPSAWDDVASRARLITSGCDAVMFTILLGNDVTQIPSATAANDTLSFVGADSSGVDDRTKARCNIAFVYEDSLLVKRLRSKRQVYTDDNDSDQLPEMIQHGFWTLVPVSTSNWLHAFSGTFSLENLPKLSPGKFFGSSVRYAIFVEPSILVTDLVKILEQMDEEPIETGSAITMVTMQRRQTCNSGDRRSTCSLVRSDSNDYIQKTMYNTIRFALKGDLMGGGLTPYIDSSFLAHSLQGEDAKMLRCDVYSESTQWGTSSVDNSLDFVMSLHDFWSRAGSHWTSERSADSDSADTTNSLLGVLSSTDTRSFAKVVSPEEINFSLLS